MSRTPDQVAASAAAMDRARAAGLPDDLLLVLLAARDAWWYGSPWPPTVELAAVLKHPGSRALDEVLCAMVRRRLSDR